jgi:hypothetical protein
VSTVLLALRSEEDINVKMYLPKWYSDVDVGHFEDINNGRKKYNLISKGKLDPHVTHTEFEVYRGK